MGKIKLNLVSGAVVEKPLINAFNANNNTYIVLDNEINGSMGLPIILVCKFENERLIKITDQGEWQVVKEQLKNIIAGNQIEFIKVNNELSADDIYYTQLTLPVPSFDALKNAYKVEEVAPVEEMVNIMDAPLEMNAVESIEQPMEMSTPILEPVTAPENIPTAPLDDVVEPVIPEIPTVHAPIETNINNVFESEPTLDIDLNAPALDIGMISSAVIEPVIPNVEQPVINPAEDSVIPEAVANGVNAVDTVEVDNNQSIVVEDLFKEQKEAFMQACENMFDALVQKFKKELEERK